MIKALLIMGAEESLQYLNNDIKLLKESFESIGINADDISGNKFSILSELGKIIDQLGSTDTLIIYYTGHGVIRRNSISFKVGSANRTEDFLSVNELGLV